MTVAKKRNPKKLALIGALSLAAVTIIGVGSVSAAQNHDQTSIVDKIASRFNLNKADVQKVFDENRVERHEAMKDRQAERLQKAVDAKEITAEQRDKIVAKHEELSTFRDSLRDKSPAERKEAMKSKKAELETWAKANAIPEKYVMPLGGKGMGRMHGPGDMHDAPAE
ncbi:hypothetical protein KBC99_00785 [Candidatus Saccharibacteria bacterium]|nr:hypothetical protein [Candidatus Saccharibacteria bacterium]